MSSVTHDPVHGLNLSATGLFPFKSWNPPYERILPLLGTLRLRSRCGGTGIRSVGRTGSAGRSSIVIISTGCSGTGRVTISAGFSSRLWGRILRRGFVINFSCGWFGGRGRRGGAGIRWLRAIVHLMDCSIAVRCSRLSVATGITSAGIPAGIVVVRSFATTVAAGMTEMTAAFTPSCFRCGKSSHQESCRTSQNCKSRREVSHYSSFRYFRNRAEISVERSPLGDGFRASPVSYSGPSDSGSNPLLLRND